MRKTASSIAILIILGILYPCYAKGTTQEIVPTGVQSQLDAHIKEYIDAYEATHCTADVVNDCRGKEYKDTRSFCFGDIDGDGRDDIAVLYMIEGFCCGSNWYSYLAVFLNKGDKYEFITSEKVAADGERAVEFNAIRDRKILLDTKEYLPDDPMCCPCGTGKTTYSLKGGKLIESERIGEKLISPIERFQRQLDQVQPLVDRLLNEKERQKRTDAP